MQGVGYRFFCHRLATGLGLAGWIRNNPDGSVSIRAEGDRGLIEELIENMKIGPRAANVKDVKVRWIPFSSEFKSFEVVR